MGQSVLVAPLETLKAHFCASSVWGLFGNTLYLYSIKLGQLLCWDNPRGSYTFHIKVARSVLVFYWFCITIHSAEV